MEVRQINGGVYLLLRVGLCGLYCLFSCFTCDVIVCSSDWMLFLIEFMLAPRVLNSHKDALFCAQFVKVRTE